MSTVQLTYDADRHGIAVKEPGHKSVAIGCTYHGAAIDDLSAGIWSPLALRGVCCSRWARRLDRIELDIRDRRGCSIYDDGQAVPTHG